MRPRACRSARSNLAPHLRSCHAAFDEGARALQFNTIPESPMMGSVVSVQPESPSIRFLLEPLESRQLLSHAPSTAPAAAPVNWVPFAHLIAQDQAVVNFPKLTGKGVGVAIIDRGVDTNHPQLA